MITKETCQQQIEQIKDELERISERRFTRNLHYLKADRPDQDELFRLSEIMAEWRRKQTTL